MSNEYNAIKIGNLTKTGMLSQVEKYQSDLSGKKANPDALYFIMISGNDWDSMRSDMNIADEAAVADVTLENIRTAIKNLSNLGQNDFLWSASSMVQNSLTRLG